MSALLILRTPARARRDGLAGQLHQGAELLGEVRDDERPAWHVNFASGADARQFAAELGIDDVRVLAAMDEDAAAIRSQLRAAAAGNTLH